MMLRKFLRPFQRLAAELILHITGWILPVLVVVDMQPEFCRECAPNALKSVAREIKRAMRWHQPIIFLECRPEDHGLTYKELRRLVKGYDRVVFVRKRGMNGSRHVLKACAKHGFCDKHFRICGVYTHYCIEETAMGIVRNKRARVDVVRRACNDPSGNDWSKFGDDWKKFPQAARVSLV
jgi:isochorismate hydrolase